jgi:formylglycine-generating enzyme required for sulfatase activity
MRAMGVGAVDHEGPEGGGVAWARSTARARFAAAAAIAVTAILAVILAPGAGVGRNSAESGSNVPAAAGTAGSVRAQGDSHVKTRKFGSDVVLGAAAAAAVSMGALAGDAVQWRVADGGNGHWYQLLQSPPGTRHWTWSDAATTATVRGAHLATFGSNAECAAAYAGLGLAESMSIIAWIGLLQYPGSAEPDGGWYWCTGETVTFVNWKPGNPDDAGCSQLGNHQDFAIVGSGGDDRWDDHGDPSPTCPYGVSYAIVEFDADCNADGIVDYGQILAGQLADANSNGIPDICECATHPELGACRCAGDIVADGTVNGADLGTLLAYWGPRTSGSFSIASDINSDGHIDGSDLGVLLANWGTCTPAGPTVPGWATLIEAFPDPAVVTDPALRMAIAATGLAWRVRDTGTRIEMLLVPPGMFQMGCSAASTLDGCPSLELPVHAVTITSAYYLGRHEVTQSQWQAQTGSNPSAFQGSSDSQSRPVESVSWNAVQALLAARGMRLPTEAEWEYACRAGTTTAFYNGSNEDATVMDLGWWNANSTNQTHPVGSKQANRLGLYDMAGNVWEWTADWWDGAKTPYTANPQTDPAGQLTGSYRAVRGGGWNDTTRYLRSSARGNGAPNSASSQVGFRAARNP